LLQWEIEWLHNKGTRLAGILIHKRGRRIGSRIKALFASQEIQAVVNPAESVGVPAIPEKY